MFDLEIKIQMIPDTIKNAMRPASQSMKLERLGAMHQSRLSFMRSLMRRVMREKWQIEPDLIELDIKGYGTVIYKIQTPNHLFNFVIFSNYLADEDRNDRVIAEQWDLTMVLVDGHVDSDYLEKLRDNVPKQEAGRVDSRVLVLSRANRSARNFNYVVDQLANGQQPDVDLISKVGYLYRTTAVYGSGKFGMADWAKVKTHFVDFSRPFAAEMMVCFMIRNFSFYQADHIAQHKNPEKFTPLDPSIKRFFGIGNSTGLGMAPFLINHPKLINQWIEVREIALATIRQKGQFDDAMIDRFKVLIERCKTHTKKTETENEWQSQNNLKVLDDLDELLSKMNEGFNHWNDLIEWSEEECSLQGQELIVSVLLELYPELVDHLDNQLSCDERFELNPVMTLAELKEVIETKYDWALAYDFSKEGSHDTFWYRSEVKSEPRLGNAQFEPGQEKQMALGIAYNVRQCFDQISKYLELHPEHSTAQFLLAYPQLRGIVRRIQTMSLTTYGEIQANLLDEDVIPLHLLRAKLAFFGVGKFDPRSKLWVRNTMFQGAPIIEDIGQEFDDDWFMPLAPDMSEQKFQVRQ